MKIQKNEKLNFASSNKFWICDRKSKVTSAFGLFISILIIIILLIPASFIISKFSTPTLSVSRTENEPNCLTSHETYNLNSYSTIKNYKRYAVAVDNSYCSNVGKEILVKNGSAVDAAIAAGLCNGIMNSQSAGIGGGNFIVIYLREKRKTYAINGRETAPINAFETMFSNKSSIHGGLATAIPGEIYGYWEAHKLGGKLAWKTLFEPSIKMCKEGFQITEALAEAIEMSENYIRNNPELSNIFIDKTTNKIFKAHETIKMPKLAQTLEFISENDITYFYNSNFTKLMVQEINENGGNVTLEDFKNYRAIVSDAITVNLDDDYKLVTTSLPSSGVLVSFIMKIMKRLGLDKSIFQDKKKEALFLHRLIESFKHAFAHRTLFGDESNDSDIEILLKNLQNDDYIKQIVSKINDNQTYPPSYYSNIDLKEDHGTTHLSVLANGDAVSLTSTINLFFGAAYSGKYTGIIYNNQMDDFSTPNSINFFGLKPSQANFIRPNKRPMSSMSPIIIIDRNDDVKLILGASGGTKIISSVAQVAIKTLWLDRNLKDSIDDRRIHHQLYPEYVQFEDGFDFETQNMLRLFGHKVECFELGGSIIQGIHQKCFGDIDAYCDPRKGGTPDGL